MTVYDAEIDLRPYIFSIVRSWNKIALLVLIAVVIAVVVSLTQPNEYKATATILITRSRPSLALADEFPTLVEPVDSASRLNAFLSISRSDTLAQNSIDALGDDLSPADQDVEDFKKRVSITSSGDVVLVTASAQDPDLAAKIANAWAEQAVLSINAAYSGEQLPSRLQAQREEALKEYESAQVELESFLQTGQEFLLQRQLQEAETLLSSLTNTRAWQIAYYTQRMQNLDQIISQSEALQQQLTSGSTSTAAGIGDALAVLQVRASAFGVILTPVTIPDRLTSDTSRSNPVINVTTESPPREILSIDLQIGDLSSITGPEDSYEQDLEVLISLARTEKSKAEEMIQELSSGVLQNQPDDLTQQAANQVQVLTAQLESEKARSRELNSDRDLAWRAYHTLVEKETELRNASQTSNQVSLATQAVPPQRPSSRGLIVNTIIAIVVSLVIGSLIVVGSYWWRTSVKAPVVETPSPVVDLK
jgi:capsular polysaccharide biosynthesis protein